MHERKPSPTSIIAVLALFAALGGTALASNYLISSTSQIKPSVLKKLKGNTGPNGKQGPRGKQGPQGSQGSQGLPGPQGVPGSQGVPGRQGVPGPQGRAGTASAWGTVAEDGQFSTQGGFPGGNTHPEPGIYCIPAPAGKAGEAVALTLVNGVGHVLQRTPDQFCGEDDFEIWAVDVSGTEFIDRSFNILVP